MCDKKNLTSLKYFYLMMTSLKRDLINEIHAPVRRNFPRRKVIIKGLNDLSQIDLVEMIPYSKENKGYKYYIGDD